MPHFITIIKYEFIIVKYILAFYHTIADLSDFPSARRFAKSNPFCGQL